MISCDIYEIRGVCQQLEIAQKWDISTRRVTTLCKDGRIDGAVQKSGIWLIPHTAKKPENMKRGRKAGNKRNV